MVNYELMLILSPGFEKTLEEIRKLITGENGVITFEDIWGLRDLAYRIKGNNQGYYVVLNFSFDPAEIKNLERTLTITPELLRFLLLKTDKNYTPKSLKEYEQEAILAREEQKAQEEAKKEEKKPAKVEKRPYVKKPVKETAKKIEKTEKEEKEEEVEEVKEIKMKEPAKKTTLEEVDEKLKSIIDDPDITL